MTPAGKFVLVTLGIIIWLCLEFTPIGYFGYYHQTAPEALNNISLNNLTKTQ